MAVKSSQVILMCTLNVRHTEVVVEAWILESESHGFKSCHLLIVVSQTVFSCIKGINMLSILQGCCMDMSKKSQNIEMLHKC